MNLKRFVTISIGTLAALLLIAGGGYFMLKQQKPHLPTSLSSQQQEQSKDLPPASANWVKATFPSHSYRHAVDIWYPDNWFFSCCGDKNGSSSHFVSPLNFEQIHPYFIVVTDYVLVGCPNGGPYGCFENARLITAEQFYERMQTLIDAETGLENLKKAGTTKLKGLGVEALRYSGVTNKYGVPDAPYIPVDLYLAKGDQWVVDIQIYNPAQFTNSFIREFLDRLQSNQLRLAGSRVNELLEEVQQRGSVRVIITLDVPFQPEGGLQEEALNAQRGAIENAKNELLQELKGTRHNVTRQFITVPSIALEASFEALQVLDRSKYIKAVDRDEASAPLSD